MALTTCDATTQPVRTIPVVCGRLREASERVACYAACAAVSIILSGATLGAYRTSGRMTFRLQPKLA